MLSIRLRGILPCVVFGVVLSATRDLRGDTLQKILIPPGYSSFSLELGIPFGGSIAQDPADPARLYVSAGNFGDQQILRVNPSTGTTATVAIDLGFVGGLAVLSNGDLAITDNDDFSSDTILKAHDTNSDGDFLDAGEITELIAPILVDNTFTGAQMTVAPAGNASLIPAGSLVVQTADGGTSSELLIIENPTTAPAYRPPGSAYFSGFTYNGGVAFDPDGNLLVGSSEFPNGKIYGLVNSNGDTNIDAGESNVIVGASGLPNSIADLCVTADRRLLFSENSGTIRTLQLPLNLLSGTASPGVFATTNAGYISSTRLDFPNRSFAPGGGGSIATLYLGGFVTFPAATNLLGIRPAAFTAAESWQYLE